MQRLVCLGVVAVAVTGCDGWDFEFPDYDGDGVLYAATRGVVIADDGTNAHAGMYGTTCEVDATNGWVGSDYDYPGEDEQVTDVGRFDGKRVVVVSTLTGVDLLSPSTDEWYWDDPSVDFPALGVVDAALVDDGVVILQDDPADGCTVRWTSSDNAVLVDVDDAWCADSPGLSADPTTGTAFVSSRQGTFSVSPTEVTEVDAEADLSVFDPYAGIVYTAQIGGSWVAGMTPDGDQLWHTDLDAAVVSLDDMGWREAAAVLVDTGSGMELYTVDASTGVATLDMQTPPGANEVVFSDNGRSFALVRAEEVHFLELGRHSLE